MKHKSLAVLVAVLVLVPAVAMAQTNVRCESNGKMRQCGVPDIGSVRLANQLSSRSSCIEGETWGYSGNTIWVDRGCRADFIVTPSSSSMLPPNGITVACESSNNTRHTCVADTRFGVQISRQLSSNVCVQGQTWGYTSSGVWVDRGCRAEFVVLDSPPPMASSGYSSSGYAGALTCESKNNIKHTCRADTRFGVTLVRQLSGNACDFNSSWGFTSRGVWVDRGCRGEFSLGRP
jgi:hypothetical protein